MKIRFDIGKHLSLPEEAVTETFGILAQKGFGKTYAAQKLAEQMMKANAQVVAIDPVGNWWCLRVAADGKSKWSDIPTSGTRSRAVHSGRGCFDRDLGLGRVLPRHQQSEVEGQGRSDRAEDHQGGPAPR